MQPNVWRERTLRWDDVEGASGAVACICTYKWHMEPSNFTKTPSQQHVKMQCVLWRDSNSDRYCLLLRLYQEVFPRFSLEMFLLDVADHQVVHSECDFWQQTILVPQHRWRMKT
jgi:hypothetical protein